MRSGMNNFFVSKSLWGFFFLCLFVLACGSCNSPTPPNTDQSEYFDGSGNKITGSNPHPFAAKGIINVDTMYSSLPHLTNRDLCNKYLLKSNYCFEAHNYS